MSEGMTVGDLRDLIADLPDEAEIILGSRDMYMGADGLFLYISAMEPRHFRRGYFKGEKMTDDCWNRKVGGCAFSSKRGPIEAAIVGSPATQVLLIVA